MPSKTFADFWWEFILLAVIGGIIAQTIANLITPFFQRRLGMPFGVEQVMPSPTIAIPKRWYPRMWLYYVLGLAVLMVTLLLWTAFWYPLLNTSVVAGLPIAYQLLIPLVSALLYIVLCYFLIGVILGNILSYEARVQQKGYEFRKFFYLYVMPLGVICGSLVIIEASYVGFELLRGRIILTADGLMLLIYASIFAVSVIWLVLMFLLRTPLLLRAFEDSKSSGES